jgi:hypothetical protein
MSSGSFSGVFWVFGELRIVFFKKPRDLDRFQPVIPMSSQFVRPKSSAYNIYRSIDRSIDRHSDTFYLTFFLAYTLTF